MASKKNENIFVIIGEDTEFVKNEINKIEELIKNKGSVDIISFFAEETDTQHVINNCNTFSVFSNNILVKLYDFHKADLDLIEEYINNPNPITTLILISFENTKNLTNKKITAIKSKSRVIESKTLYDNQIVEKIHTYLKGLRLKYNDDVVEYIAQQVGNVETGINKFFEIIKESGFKDIIKLEDIKEIETFSSEKNLFSFIDYFFSKNIISAINIYKSIINEGTPLLVINKTIYNKALLYIKYLSLDEEKKSQSEIMSELGISNQWYFNKTKQEALKFGNYEALKFILKKCFEIEKSIKSEDEELTNTRFEIFLSDFKKDFLNI